MRLTADIPADPDRHITGGTMATFVTADNITATIERLASVVPHSATWQARHQPNGRL